MRRAGNMSCKVLKLYFVDACLSRFNLINLGEASLSLNNDGYHRLDPSIGNFVMIIASREEIFLDYSF